MKRSDMGITRLSNWWSDTGECGMRIERVRCVSPDGEEMVSTICLTQIQSGQVWSMLHEFMRANPETLTPVEG